VSRKLHRLVPAATLPSARSSGRWLGYALTDSPVGQLAWIVEKFKDWTDCVERPEDAVDRDAMLSNVMLYWLTGTAGSSAQLYYESARGGAWRSPRRCPWCRRASRCFRVI
jgi:hypothetical protein